MNEFTKEYSSCNQVAKDVINKLLVEKTLSVECDRENDCIITLDAEHNGTSVECRKHFNGLISVPQIDAVVATVQEKHWRKRHPQDRMWLVHPKHNICNDLPNLAQFWSKGKNILLWNFDLFSTFYTFPVQLVENLCMIPHIAFSITTGTLVAFTFAAIPHGGVLSKLKNSELWSDRLAHFANLKKMKKKEIMNHYYEEMGRVWEQKRPSCVRVEPVEVDVNRMQGEDAIYYHGNALLYEGSNSNESTMCMLLYRIWHDHNCQVEHRIPVKEAREPSSRKRTREMQEFEENVVKELSHVEKPKRVRTGSDNDDSDDNGMHVESVESNSENSEREMKDSDGNSMSETEMEDSDDNSTSDFGSSSVGDSGSRYSSAFLDEDSDLITILSSTDCSEDTEVEMEMKDLNDLSNCELYPHQMDMMVAIRENERGYVNAICGSGKSLPMTRSCLSFKTSVIFVPFKVLVEQFYARYFGNNSDIVVHKVNSEYMEEVPGPRDGETTVYIANFDSLHRLTKLGIIFDIVHWDEAHLATSRKRRGKIEKMSGEGNEALDMEEVQSIQAKKHIFWTATPNKIMKSHLEIYGEEIYRYDFSTATNDQVIKSFGIFISCNKGDEGDDGEDNDWTKFEKVVSTTCNFIQNEGRKRVLIYVNRVSETDGNHLTVEHLRKQRKLFPASYRMDFISAKTKLNARNKIFHRFSSTCDDDVHVIVSCRTISVGVDLPTCDTVVFADVTRNVTEIIQRGCRPLRLTEEERRAKRYENAKIFFPVNVSAAELQGLLTASERNEKVHRSIRGNPLEIPMLVLNMLKDGLDVDLDFSRNKHDAEEENEDDENEDCGRKEDEGNQDENEDYEDEDEEEFQYREKIPVSFDFPFSDYIWEESNDNFASTMNNLCAQLKKLERIPGWNEWDDEKRAKYLANWCIEHGKRKPKRAKDVVEDKLAEWLSNMGSKKNRHKLRQSVFDIMKQFDWWEPWLEGLEKEKVERIPGFDSCTVEQKISFLLQWCIEHGKRKPKRAKDVVEDKLAEWLKNLSVTQKRHKLRQSVFDIMKQFDWWEPWLEGLEKGKVERIPGFDSWTDEHKISFLVQWCIAHEKRKPKRAKDVVEDKLAEWLSNMSVKQKRHKLRQSVFDIMKQFDWWEPWLEGLETEKVERIPGFKSWTKERKISFLVRWCIDHEKRKPKRAKNAMETKLAQWLSKMGGKNHRHKLGQAVFDIMKQFDWWGPWLEGLEKEKVEEIPGFDSWTFEKRISFLVQWCIDHEKRKPKKAKDIVETKLASWLCNMGGKKYRHKLWQPELDIMKQFDWWKPWLEGLEKEKVEKIPGFDSWTVEQRISFLVRWCIDHEKRKPKQAKGVVEAKLAEWLSTMGSKKNRHKLRQPVFDIMKQFDWWEPWLEGLESRRGVQ